MKVVAHGSLVNITVPLYLFKSFLFRNQSSTNMFTSVKCVGVFSVHFNGLFEKCKWINNSDLFDIYNGFAFSGPVIVCNQQPFFLSVYQLSLSNWFTCHVVAWQGEHMLAFSDGFQIALRQIWRHPCSFVFSRPWDFEESCLVYTLTNYRLSKMTASNFVLERECLEKTGLLMNWQYTMRL